MRANSPLHRLIRRKRLRPICDGSGDIIIPRPDGSLAIARAIYRIAEETPLDTCSTYFRPICPRARLEGGNHHSLAVIYRHLFSILLSVDWK